MSYTYLIFDVDDTLLNFRSAYFSAQRAVAAALGVEHAAEFMRVDEELSWKYWGEFGLDNTSDPDVQAHYHTYYSAYLRKHFSEVARFFKQSADAEKLIETYFSALMASREPVEDDTLEVYAKLAEKYKMVVATNGIGKVQRARLQAFLPMTSGVFISEELGTIKPAAAFYRKMVDELHSSPEACLMIGDSVSNDINGAAGIGMPGCWYNHKSRTAPEGFHARYVIEKIQDLLHFL